jgi:archaellum component FlaF (FlaF/FlaG flagellin family)
MGVGTGVGAQRLAVFFLLVLALFPAAFAVDHIIVNSQDWRDVYTGIQYSYLTGTPGNFLVSTKHSTILLYSIPTDQDEVLILTSRERPFVVGYEDILRSRGYDAPDEVRSNNLNLELLRRLEGVTRFIVIDDAYGYNAISVAPFSQVDKSFVVFADSDTINDVLPVLQSKNPERVLVYGQVDREVKDALAPLNPEFLNKGNRFNNNIEIVDRYLALKPTKQVILTNGEFIEAGIMSGADPVLFLGRQNVPENVRAFITDSGIEVGILIGNELVNSATFVRRTLGISVFVKFAQGARQPTGAISTVEDLDRFPMPRYDLGIEIVSIVYNKATGALQVTYHNTVGLAEYFKSTITLRDGTVIKITGDKNPLFLDKNEYKTVVYYTDSDGSPLNLQATDLTGDVFTVFGEGPQSLENTYQKSFQIELIDILDDAQINITDLYYDQAAGKFYVRIENTGTVDAYVSAELLELLVNGEATTFGSDEVVLIPAGKGVWLPITVELSDADIAENPTVRVRAYFGERELSRVKIVEAEFPMRESSFLETSLAFVSAYGVYIIILILLLPLLFLLMTKKKCKHCGKKNARGRKTCVECGQKF